MSEEISSVEPAQPPASPQPAPPPASPAEPAPAQSSVEFAPEPPAAPVAPAPELSGTLEQAPAPTAVVPPSAPAAPTPPEGQQLPAEWPYKGYTGPQPWEADNPPAITHNQRMLSSGTNGEEVVVLGGLLAAIGYPNPISEGGNPHAVYDSSMGAAVRQFCSEYGVGEDPAIIAAMTADVVGPWIWEALFRAAHRAAS